ncbi:hypothetical protein FB45DRAFT_910024 [Roridomyces roridus]|uniref:Uncharacterized protein n=1 Tax=Roridomyces roridus TaxID=1738132 RepID=A0AAD7FRB1_9AGAR|nr:hypothetical protein FB45DRAFT_910024 [Roridomyces roridus]
MAQSAPPSHKTLRNLGDSILLSLEGPPSFFTSPPSFAIMPYPLNYLVQEPADARAALMEKIAPYLQGAARRPRYLQAERPQPYRVRSPPKRPRLSVESRQAERIMLGWGAFLKDETLRSPEGEVVRTTEGPCGTQFLPCPSPYSPPPRRDCDSDEDSDCSMPLYDPRRASYASPEPDCAMPGLEYFAQIEPPPLQQTVYDAEWMSDQSCVEAADELFVMFIDENCMEP